MQNRNNDIKVRDDLHELKQHGSLDYPVGAYHVNLLDMYLSLIRWHWHEELEINLVLKGEARFLVHDSTIILKEGEGIFVNQNALHSVNASPEKECEIYSIVFHPEFLFGYSHSNLSSQYLLPLINNTDLRYQCFYPSKETDAKIIDLATELCQVNTKKEFGYELKTKSILAEIWLLLLSYRKNDFKANTKSELAITADEMRAKEGITYIAQHFAEQITLQEIADSIHISKSECCRCFKRCLRVTPFEYLLKYRIYAAVGMISKAEKAISISDIAMQTGFNSSSYFNKIFKKYIGCTPSEYKRSLNQGQTHTVDFLVDHTNISQK